MEKQKIGAVNILDIRRLTEERLASTPKIGAVNIILYSAQNAHLASRLEVGAVNAMVEVPDGIEFHTALKQIHLDKRFFDAQQAPANLLVIGHAHIDADVTEKEFQEGIGALVVIGNVVCPEHLTGVLLRKATKVIGATISYPPLKLVKFDELTLDEDYLHSIADSSELAVVGSLKVPDVLPAGLFERKVTKLFVSGAITCHAEDLAAIQARLVRPSEKITTIPAGMALVEKHLILDANYLSVVPVRRLYVTDSVLIDPSVTPALLDEKIDALTSKEMVISPAGLKDVLARKVNMLKQQVILYEGTLWLFDGQHVLYPARFEALEGQATVVVTGDLIVDEQVDQAVLKARLAKVHNLGTILCSREQMSAIEARLGIREGQLDEITPKGEDEKVEHPGVGAFNILVL